MPYKLRTIVLLSLTLTLCASSPALPWFDETHRLITVKAVEVLPPEIRPLYESRLKDLKRLCTEPDTLWKDPKQWEAHPEWKTRSNWHFLDIDHFHFPYPFKEFPRARAGADSLYTLANAVYGGRGNAGYLPWTVEDYYRALVEAWKKGDTEAVIQNSGYLSHFAGDASMPLHATRNYKGQFSGNIQFKTMGKYNDPDYDDRTIHERLEGGLVERHLSRFEDGVKVGESDRKQIADVPGSAFDVILESYFHLDKIIAADKIIMEKLNLLTEDKKTFDARRDDYYRAFDEQVGQLAADRLRAGAVYLGNLWYSAWVEAGKPTVKK